jgi:hypothetical protein
VYPSGIKYKDIEQIIDTVARAKAHQYGSVSYLDQQDLIQEVKIKCWKVLNSYNPDRKNANLLTFLSVCADNRIKDLRRILVYKHNKPCVRCIHHSKGKCTKFKKRMECKQFEQHEMRIKNKLSCSNTVDICGHNVYDKKSERFIEDVDFYDFIYTHLPQHLHQLFDQLRDANFDFRVLKPRQKKMMRCLLAEIYVRYGSK